MLKLLKALRSDCSVHVISCYIEYTYLDTRRRMNVWKHLTNIIIIFAIKKSIFVLYIYINYSMKVPEMKTSEVYNIHIIRKWENMNANNKL